MTIAIAKLPVVIAEVPIEADKLAHTHIGTNWFRGLNKNEGGALRFPRARNVARMHISEACRRSPIVNIEKGTFGRRTFSNDKWTENELFLMTVDHFGSGGRRSDSQLGRRGKKLGDSRILGF